MRIYKEFEVKNTSNSILYIRFLFSETAPGDPGEAR